jgi:RNA polymerase sigma-70 factor, ECF subfamily
VSYPDKTTEELIWEIKRGLNVDENFRHLYKQSYAQIHRYFQRRRFSPEDSHELTQETFFAVFKNLKGFRQEAPFENWLFAIARNMWRSERKRRCHDHHIPLNPGDQGSSDRREPPVEPPVDPAPGPLDRTMDKEIRQILHEEMRQLPPQMRRCVEVRIINELSYKEIAKVMGLSIGAVRAHLHEKRRRR